MSTNRIRSERIINALRSDFLRIKTMEHTKAYLHASLEDVDSVRELDSIELTRDNSIPGTLFDERDNSQCDVFTGERTKREFEVHRIDPLVTLLRISVAATIAAPMDLLYHKGGKTLNLARVMPRINGGSTENRTQINGLKVRYIDRYVIEPSEG